jgi:glutamate synthase domain-containing protein 2
MIPLLAEHWGTLLAGVILLALLGLALHDVTQRKRTILHNFPVVGHLRYLLEAIGPELRQYWVADDRDEQPFNRAERRWIYATSKGQNNTFGFGTSELLYSLGYPVIKHATFPFPEASAHHPGGDRSAIPGLKVMGQAHGRRRPYRPRSVVNISAMSFGSLGSAAVTALNRGALQSGCFHNTGEGGLSPYHHSGADVIWQLGTGYFGARTASGRFSLDVLDEKIKAHPFVRGIEIKLSQGAKPGKGGILPGRKVTPQIALIRGVEAYKDCISPNSHSEFQDVDGLIDFVERIADRTGLPVGIKAAVGELHFWDFLARRMRERKGGPDWIAIDGGEGGTGAAPLTFADHVSLPFKVALARVYPLFQQAGVADDVVWIGSGKLGFPDRAVVAFAMGCDLVSVAREAMISLGCIQAQQCHTDRCPAGVATHSRWLQAGLDVTDKAQRAARFIQGFRKELLALSHAAGYQHPLQFTGEDIEISVGANRFAPLSEVVGYRRNPVAFTSMRVAEEEAPAGASAVVAA